MFWCRMPFKRHPMKRESGENPGQTRCCNSPYSSRIMPLAHAGKALREGKSQKTCQSDIQFCSFRETKHQNILLVEHTWLLQFMNLLFGNCDDI